MATNNKIPHIKNQIDFVAVFQMCWQRRTLYIKVLSIVFVVSAIYVFSLPRFYTTEVKLAPETASSSGGSLSSLASLANIKLGSSSATDAIYPEIYPELFASKTFLVSLFNIKVTPQGETEPITLYDYLAFRQKIPFWIYPINAITNFINKFKSKDSSSTQNKGGLNPFQLTLDQDGIAQFIGSSVNCSVDKHTDVITLVATAQDPLVSALLADSLMSRLQDFIIDYRTNKARVDVSYSERLLKEAKIAYDNARNKYTSFADTHDELYLASYKAEQENLENEMQLAYNAYSQVAQQLQVAKAKVQERTPVFTTIEAATVPLKPAGPKRVMTILVHLFFTFLVITAYIYFKPKKEKNESSEVSDNKGVNPSSTKDSCNE